MSRITVKKLLQHAKGNQYAVGYFESWNLESTQAVIRAAENMNSPVMIGVCGTYIGEPKRQYKESLSVYYAMLAQLAKEATVPVALLLNEADDEQMVLAAASLGFDMVMYAPVFSSSALSLQDLAEVQKRVVEHAHPLGVAVEGEVGELPLVNSATGEIHDGADTDPKVCLNFVKETGIDTVAVAVGNCHLKEDGMVTINYQLLKELAEMMPVPLVLHGGTSIRHEDLTKAASMGVAKVNFGTGMKRAVLSVAKKYFAENDVDQLEPNDVIGRGGTYDLAMLEQQAVITYVESTMKALNSVNKAF